MGPDHFRTCLFLFGGMSAEAMHKACKKDNRDNNGIVKAFREGGWTAYRPTSKGLKPAQGLLYNNLPLGSSRLNTGLVKQRSFIPQPPHRFCNNVTPPPPQVL